MPNLLSENIEFKGDRIVKIKGTKLADKVSVDCRINSGQCKIIINDETGLFSYDEFPSTGIILETYDGDDQIFFDSGDKVLLSGFQIFPGQGKNYLNLKFFKPYSLGLLSLEEGSSNVISFDENGSNLVIKGFRNSPENKLEFRGTSLQYSDLKLLKGTDEGGYELVISGKGTIKDKSVCSFYNKFTPNEIELWAKLHVAKYIDGEDVASKYPEEAYILDGPKELILPVSQVDFTDN